MIPTYCSSFAMFTKGVIRPRLLKRSLLIYILIVIALVYIFEILLFQTPSSRQTSYNQARNNVLDTVQKIGNFEDSVLPNQSTVILEPSHGLTCQESGAGLFILFVIVSAPNNVERRDVIRSTFQEMQPQWEQHFSTLVDGKYESLDVTKVFQLLFFVGQSAEHGITYDVRDEWERYGDVIVDDLQESYLKLTVKTLRMLKWVLHNCPSAKYIVKMDDDVFLNVPYLMSYLVHQSPQNSQLIAGHVYKGIKPDRDYTSKWFTPSAVWEADKLPDFVAGFCYILGMKAARDLFEASKTKQLFHLEDVFLTGIVRSSLNYELSNPGKINTMLYWYQHMYGSDWPYSQFIIHQVSPAQFRCWTRGQNDSHFSWLKKFWPMLLSCWE